MTIPLRGMATTLSGPTVCRMGRRVCLALLGPLLVWVCAAWAPYAGGINLREAAPFVGHVVVRVGVGTPLAILVGGAVVGFGPTLAQRLSFRVLPWAVAGTAIAWAGSLALVDGLAGIRAPLTVDGGYLSEVPRVHGLHLFLAEFVQHIHSYDTGPRWGTDVAGHPPGLVLVFAGLRQLGLNGPWPPALLCLLVGASATAAVVVTVSHVVDEATARLVAPFMVILPAAVWVAVSGDAFFLGVSAWGVALLARGGQLCSAGGGALLGCSLLLSYGLLTFGLVPLVVLAVRRDWRNALIAAAACSSVVLAPALLGFRWWDGLTQTLLRYRDGAGGYRPYRYFIVADLAVAAIAVGPAAIAAFSSLRRHDRASWLVAAAIGGLLVADLTGESKGEVERIWLFFTPWAALATARLVNPRRWLAIQAISGLAVQTVLVSKW